MNNEEYILQRLSEITGMSVLVVKIMVYLTITTIGIGALVIMKNHGII